MSTPVLPSRIGLGRAEGAMLTTPPMQPAVSATPPATLKGAHVPAAVLLGAHTPSAPSKLRPTVARCEATPPAAGAPSGVIAGPTCRAVWGAKPLNATPSSAKAVQAPKGSVLVTSQPSAASLSLRRAGQVVRINRDDDAQAGSPLPKHLASDNVARTLFSPLHNNERHSSPACATPALTARAATPASDAKKDRAHVRPAATAMTQASSEKSCWQVKKRSSGGSDDDVERDDVGCGPSDQDAGGGVGKVGGHAVHEQALIVAGPITPDLPEEAKKGMAPQPGTTAASSLQGMPAVLLRWGAAALAAALMGAASGVVVAMVLLEAGGMEEWLYL